MRAWSRKTLSALVLAAALGAAPATATPAPEADSVAVTAVGAHALHDGSSWAAPREDIGVALTQSGPTVPSGPKAAQEDTPGYYATPGCHAGQRQTTVEPCLLGDEDGSRTWLALGSSKTGTWVDPLARIAGREGARLEVATRSATPWTPGMGSGSGRTYNDAALEHIRQTRPDVLFLAIDRPTDFPVTPGDYERITSAALAAGAGHVAILWNTGGTEPNPMTCLEQGPADYRDCTFHFVPDELESAAAGWAEQSDDLSYVSVEDWVAPEGTGYMVVGRVITRGSGSHLTATYVNSLELPLQAELSEAGLVDADPARVVRIAGADRYATAATLARRASAAATTYVASGTDYADALAAGALSGGSDRLLLARPTSLPAASRAALTTLGTGPDNAVRIVGGTQAIGPAVAAQLGELVANLVRVAGGDRYETAATLAREQGRVDRVFLASGVSWPDAVGASAAASDGEVLLLTHSDHLTGVTRSALAELQPSEVVIVGGTSVVAGSVTGQVREAVPGAALSRVAGQDRYETAATLAVEHGDPAGGVTVATGLDYPDALAAGQLNQPLLLIKPDAVPQAAREVLAGSGSVTVVGGHLAVTPAAERAVHDAL